MRLRSRSLAPVVKTFLREKMVFIGGPRQVGKTTLCQQFLKKIKSKSPGYLNWDDAQDRKKILNNEWPVGQRTLCFDELHKYLNWRSFIKGLYDKRRHTHRFLVTGSARLDHYRRGGDSLLGRYRYLRLHPFTLDELASYKASTLEQLLQFGGFPEPLFTANGRTLRLWRQERLWRLVNDDVRDLENIKRINLIELLAQRLPDCVGSPLSVKKLARDLGAHHQSVDKWLGVLESLYYCYRVAPYAENEGAKGYQKQPRIRAVKKEQKLYLWDWSAIKAIGPRFENLVAHHLLKYCHFLEDTEGYQMELRFLRDTDKREVDFVVLQEGQPLFGVECKSGDTQLSPQIVYFQNRTTIPRFYQVHRGKTHIEKDPGQIIIPFTRFVKDVLVRPDLKFSLPTSVL